MDDIIPQEENTQIATSPIFRTEGVIDLPAENTWTVGQDTKISDEIEQYERPENKIIQEDIDEKEKPNESHDELEQSEEELEERPKRKRNTSQQRIVELNRKLNEAKKFAAQILSQREELQKKLTFAQQEALSNYEKLLNSDKERIKAAKINALEENDTSKITETDDLMSQYNAALLEVKRQRDALAYSKQNDYREQIPEELFEDQPIEDDFSDEIQDSIEQWVKKNPWADKSSRYFDRDLFDEADSYSGKLKRKYILEGRGDEIGKPDFWNEITDHMKEEYQISNRNDQEPKRNFSMKNQVNNQVAPVSRTPSSRGHSNSQKQVVLNSEEREMAHSLRGFIKDKNGNPITDNATLESIYAKNIGRR